jgi:hypothetical protein
MHRVALGTGCHTQSEDIALRRVHKNLGKWIQGGCAMMYKTRRDSWYLTLSDPHVNLETPPSASTTISQPNPSASGIWHLGSSSRPLV